MSTVLGHMPLAATAEEWPGLWVDEASPQALRLLLLEEQRGARRALGSSLWQVVAGFLRFPGPMQMIYAFGGRNRDEAGYEQCLSSAEAFDFWRGAWVSLPPMAEARVGAAAAQLGRAVVVAGGYQTEASRPLSSVEAFDPCEGEWHALPPMLTSRYGLAMVTLGDRILAMGGDDGHRVTGANEEFCLSTGAWRALCPMPQPLAGGKAEVHDGLVYYVGGCDDREALSAVVWVYSPEADRWGLARCPGSPEALSLRTGRTSFAMSLLSGKAPRLLVTGGVSAEGARPYLRDTEALPLHAPTELGGADALAARATEAPPRRMATSRSGCRSALLWAQPGRPFQPWTCRPWWADSEPATAAEPFLVVLGGETPTDRRGQYLRSCVEPGILDVGSGRWVDEGTKATGAQRHMLEVARKLCVDRVAFAIVVAPGMPGLRMHSSRPSRKERIFSS